MRTLLLSIFIAVIIFPSQEITAQRKKKNTKTTSKEVSLDAFKFRNVGPAFLSGRISRLGTYINLAMVKNKHTFFSETFLFLPEYTL